MVECFDVNALNFKADFSMSVFVVSMDRVLTPTHNFSYQFQFHCPFSQVIHRHETDQQLIDEVESSEVLLRHLNARNISIEADMEVAKQVQCWVIAVVYWCKVLVMA